MLAHMPKHTCPNTHTHTHTHTHTYTYIARVLLHTLSSTDTRKGKEWRNRDLNKKDHDSGKHKIVSRGPYVILIWNDYAVCEECAGVLIF